MRMQFESAKDFIMSKARKRAELADYLEEVVLPELVAYGEDKTWGFKRLIALLRAKPAPAKADVDNFKRVLLHYTSVLKWAGLEVQADDLAAGADLLEGRAKDFLRSLPLADQLARLVLYYQNGGLPRTADRLRGIESLVRDKDYHNAARLAGYWLKDLEHLMDRPGHDRARRVGQLLQRVIALEPQQEGRAKDFLRQVAVTNLPGFEAFYRAYVEAALWSSDTEDGTPLDQIDAEIEDRTQAAMRRDCQKFYEANRHLMDDPSQGGHDFWLTRNGHGTGFWDRDNLPEDVGEVLTQAAQAFGEVNLEYDAEQHVIYEL
jgi:hypothetical protein